MPLVATELLDPQHPLPALANHQVYCGLDCCLTVEVAEELAKLGNQPPEIYAWEKALQGPYLEIMLRGFAVDQLARRQAAAALRERIGQLQQLLDGLAREVWDTGLNPRSPLQLQKFLYGTLKLPEVWLSQKGERKLSTNREALEKLEDYLYARPFTSLILAIRDLAKQAEVFETSIDSDGRYRTSYNIAGTETGRPSSSSNAFGTGGNAQNIAPGLRYVFVADPGWKLAVVDLEQVEARDEGWFIGCLFDDWSFLDACESGDLHTNNARRVWPERPWTGDRVQDRALADQLFYRDFSYRDMAKRGSHLTGYMGTAWTMSRALKIPLALAEDFQARYCRGGPGIAPAYPGIPRFWQWIAQELQTSHQLVTPFGRRRHFFGRPGDDSTLREGIAFLPQSTTADRMNLGLYRVWEKMPQVQLLAQGFDSITFQFQDRGHRYESETIQQALDLIRVEFRHPSGRRYCVPGEAKVGWNWGYQVTAQDVAKAQARGGRVPRLNEEGLAKWSPSKPDQRQRTQGLSRVMTAK